MRTKPIVGQVYWIWFGEPDNIPDLGEVVGYASDRRASMKEFTSTSVRNVPYTCIYEKLPKRLWPYHMQKIVKWLFNPRTY